MPIPASTLLRAQVHLQAVLAQGDTPLIYELTEAGYQVACWCAYQGQDCSDAHHYYNSAGLNPYGARRDASTSGRQAGHISPIDDEDDPDDDFTHDSYCDCSDCYRNTYDIGPDLHPYSHRPNLKFSGEKPPWYGMEIEITTDTPRKAAAIADSFAPSLLYCKEDSSVDGLEMVTHPMSYDWAMANFPWSVLPAIREGADGTIVPQENGIHVHVSRDGFSDSAHMYRWLKLWYRNPQDIQRIARRKASHWGSFSSEHREGHAIHVKRGKPGYYERDDQTLNNRYSAINTLNQETLEVRVFASTLRPRRAKAALQLVAGSVEYARQLTSETITHRRGWDWPAFIAWAGKDGKYPDLLIENRIRRSGMYSARE